MSFFFLHSVMLNIHNIDSLQIIKHTQTHTLRLRWTQMSAHMFLGETDKTWREQKHRNLKKKKPSLFGIDETLVEKKSIIHFLNSLISNKIHLQQYRIKD